MKLKLSYIDAHHHIWDTRQFSYGWLAHFRMLNRPFDVQDYLDSQEKANLVKSVYIESFVDEKDAVTEAKHFLALASEPDNPIEAAVVSGRPETPEFRRHLERLIEFPKLRGVRRVLHIEPDELSYAPLFRENVRSMADYKLSFDLAIRADQLPVAFDLARSCAEVVFVLDHCGVVGLGTDGQQQWERELRTLAELPNVTCKISGIPSYIPYQPWNLNVLQPIVEHAIDCFGWNRVLYGSDWPICLRSTTPSQWLSALREIVRDEDASKQRSLFHDNADRIYRMN